MSSPGNDLVVRCPRCGAGLKVMARDDAQAIRVTCPKCGNVFGVRRRTSKPVAPSTAASRIAFIGDEARPFRDFVKHELEGAGFAVEVFEDGDELLGRARLARPSLFVLNVYLRGKLGIEVCEAVKSDPTLAAAKVIFIGALFRKNRYRSNPTNLYGADEYIEEIISPEEFRTLILDFFPPEGTNPVGAETPLEKDLDEARRLARIIVSDLVLYHPDLVNEGIRTGNVEAALHEQITEARSYYDGRVPERVRKISSFFDDTLRDYVERRSREARK